MGLIRTGRDEQLVDIDNEDGCLYWSKQFDVEPEQLRQAVRVVGHRVDHIRDYVERHFTVPVKQNTAH